MSLRARLGLSLVLCACPGSDDGETGADGSSGTGSPATTTGEASTDAATTTASSSGVGDSTSDTTADESTGADDSGLIDARPYTLLVPDAYDEANPTPLIVMLHGYGVTGAVQATYFRLIEGAQTHGYLLAYPDGTVDGSGGRFWNATDACCDFGGVGVDDVAYLTALLDDVQARYNVDPARVYFMGHSNGGFMSHRMACEIGDRIAAIASLAGATYDDPTACTAADPVHVLQIHGTDDRTIAYDGGTTGAASYPSAPQTVATWADKNGCGTMLTDEGTADLEVAVPGEETQLQAYADCPPGGAVSLWTMDGAPHIPAIDEAFADAVWNWLAAHPKP